jgi:succinate-acetate transporter protein
VGKRQRIISLPFLQDIWYLLLGTFGISIGLIFVHLDLVFALLSILDAANDSRIEVFCCIEGLNYLNIT